MNKSQIKKANNLIGKLEEMLATWEEIASSARERYDNRSDKYKDSDKGSVECDNVDAIEEFCSNLQNCIDNLGTISYGED